MGIRTPDKHHCLYTLSKRAPSTTRTPLRKRCNPILAYLYLLMLTRSAEPVATNYIFSQFSSLKCMVALVEVAMVDALHEDFLTIGLIG